MKNVDLSSVIEASGDGTRLRVKVVPGASRTKVVGVLGDRLKVAVAALPEGGRANQAVCELLAGLFGVGKKEVVVESGHAQPQKTIAVIGLTSCKAAEILKAAVAK